MKYLFRNLDKQEEDNQDKHVVNDAERADDDVDNLQYKVADVTTVVRQIIGPRRSCGDVTIYIRQ